MREMGPGLAGKVGSTSGPETGRLRDRWHRRRKKEGLSPDVKEEGLDAEREAMMAEKAKQEDTDQQAA